MAIRRLIVCFDGTWNTPDAGPEPTNVVKLLRAIRCRDGEISQFAYYDKGVGTGGFSDRIAGGLSGAGLTKKIIDGYRFLGNNYADGDEIYVLGFSRGAYTARSLAGLITLAGILGPAHLGHDLDAVLDTYRDTALDRAGKRRAIDAMGLQRHADARIKCVGVWDTVGSLGIPGDLGRQTLKRLYFADVQLSPLIDVALHGVAIDEKRSEFAPTLWVSPDGKPSDAKQVVEQVWFSGVHSNVGGSYPDTGLSDIALEWMAKRIARHTGLALDEPFLRHTCRPAVDGIGYESRSALYLSSRIYPYQRLIGQAIPIDHGLGAWFRRKFKKWDRRNVVPSNKRTINEMLHLSALERWKLPAVLSDAKHGKGTPRPYRPINLEAAIRGRSVPVVDWNGERIGRDDVPWP